MARRCAVTGKGVQVGHNVSHANNKTKRRYLPNLQRTSVLSDVLGSVRLRITAAAVRTIEHKGGIDAFVRNTPDRKLSPEIRRLKRRIAGQRRARADKPPCRLPRRRSSAGWEYGTRRACLGCGYAGLTPEAVRPLGGRVRDANLSVRTINSASCFRDRQELVSSTS